MWLHDFEDGIYDVQIGKRQSYDGEFFKTQDWPNPAQQVKEFANCFI